MTTDNIILLVMTTCVNCFYSRDYSTYLHDWSLIDNLNKCSKSILALIKFDIHSSCPVNKNVGTVIQYCIQCEAEKLCNYILNTLNICISIIVQVCLYEHSRLFESVFICEIT